MAKGNNGNLLQHFVECEAAARLVQSDPGRKLHVVFTHGMAPYEPFEQDRHGPHLALDACLECAEASESDRMRSRAALLDAYKATCAAADHYPNSAELMAVVIRCRDALSGVICETDPCKQKQLDEKWAGGDVSVHEGSWRQA